MKTKLIKLICSNPLRECPMTLWRETAQPSYPVYCPNCLAIEDKNIKMIEEYRKGESVPKIYKGDIKEIKPI